MFCDKMREKPAQRPGSPPLCPSTVSALLSLSSSRIEISFNLETCCAIGVIFVRCHAAIHDPTIYRDDR